MPAQSNSGTPEKLKEYVERLEKLMDEKLILLEDIRELKKEAKDNEVDPATLAKLVRRKMETKEQRDKRQAAEDKFETWAFALGLVDS